jgi:hypothetical protein
MAGAGRRNAPAITKTPLLCILLKTSFFSALSPKITGGTEQDTARKAALRQPMGFYGIAWENMAVNGFDLFFDGKSKENQ